MSHRSLPLRILLVVFVIDFTFARAPFKILVLRRVKLRSNMAVDASGDLSISFWRRSATTQRRLLAGWQPCYRNCHHCQASTWRRRLLWSVSLEPSAIPMLNWLCSLTMLQRRVRHPRRRLVLPGPFTKTHLKSISRKEQLIPRDNHRLC